MFAGIQPYTRPFICGLLLLSCAAAQAVAANVTADQSVASSTQPLLEQWLAQGPFLQQYLQPQTYHLQILLTDIKRDSRGVSLIHHQYRPDAEYFYPASTVKLPVAVLALEFLRRQGIDANSPMLTAPAWPGDTPRDAQHDNTLRNTPDKGPAAYPSVAEDVRRILLLSDNDAYNRLYELLGPAYINQRLAKLRLTPVQIRHRLERFLTVEKNHRLPAVTFFTRQGQPQLRIPARQDPLTPLRPATPLGTSHWRDGQRIASPLDFASRNQWTLQSMHRLTLLLSSAIPSGANPALQLSATDRRLLDYYRQITPAQLVAADQRWRKRHHTNGQSTNGQSRVAPAPLNQPTHSDRSWLQNALAESPATVKFLYYGAAGELDPDVVIRNKVGDAYGFYLDTAWFCDTVSGREFVLSALIYANSDGELGDSRYDDKTLALPYLRWLGRQAVTHARHQAELTPSSAEAIAYCRDAATLTDAEPM